MTTRDQREQCARCDHAKDSHHKRQYACLAMFCDCDGYCEDKPADVPKRPAEHPPWCGCYACVRAAQ